MPKPLDGACAFVYRFDHRLLGLMANALPYVLQLVRLSETEAFEQYLIARWRGSPFLGALPVGPEAVGLLRLAAHSHMPAEQNALITSFRRLPKQQRQLLSDELVTPPCYKMPFY